MPFLHCVGRKFYSAISEKPNIYWTVIWLYFSKPGVITGKLECLFRLMIKKFYFILFQPIVSTIYAYCPRQLYNVHTV